MLRVALADDNPEFVGMLREFIGFQLDMQVCGTAYTGQDALELVRNQNPVVLVLDGHCPGTEQFAAPILCVKQYAELL